MTIPYEKVVLEDLDIGVGTVSITNPQGGSLTGNQLGTHTWLGNAYNVERDFSAACDGSTNDTSAIQSALDQASSDGGGVVIIPAGKTCITTQLLMPSNVFVYSQGGTLKFPDDTTANILMFRYATTTTNCGVLGTLFMHGGDTQTNSGDTGQIAIQIQGACTDMYFDRLVMTNFSKDGLHFIDNSGTPATPQRIFFNNLHITGSGRNGISITAGQDIYFNCVETRNSDGDNPEAGVDIEPNNDADIIKNITFNKLHTHDNDGEGLQIACRTVSSDVVQGNVTIHELNCHNNGANGSVQVGIAGTSHIKILSGAIYGSEADGSMGVRMASNVRHIKILNCDIYENKHRGVSLAQSSETITSYDIDLSGCRIYNNGQQSANTVDGVLMSTTAQTLAKVTLRDVYLYDDQAVPTQRYGLNIGTGVTEVHWEGKAWGNATGTSTGALDGTKETSMVTNRKTHFESDLTFAEIADGASGDATITVNGLATPFEYSILATPDNNLQGGLSYYAFCSDTNEVTVRVTNSSGGALTPNQLDWMIQIWEKD